MFIEQAQSMTLILQVSKFDPNAALKLEGKLIDGKLPEYDYNTGLASINEQAEKLRQGAIKELDVTNYESPYAMGSGVIISTNNIRVNVDYSLKSSDAPTIKVLPFYFFPEEEKESGKLTQTYIKFGGEYGFGGTILGEIEIGLISNNKGNVNPYITLNGGLGKGISAEFPVKFGTNEINGKENNHSISGLDFKTEVELSVTTPWRTFYSTNGVGAWNDEKGLAAGASFISKGNLTIVIPTFKESGDYISNLFYNTEQGQSFSKDMKYDIDHLKNLGKK